MRSSTALISFFLLLVSFASAEASLDDLTEFYESFPELETRDIDFFGEPEEVEGAALEARQNTQRACAKGVHVIAAGGDGADNKGKYGYILSMVTNITSSIPGSNSVTLPYNKGSKNGLRKTTRGVCAIHLRLRPDIQVQD